MTPIPTPEPANPLRLERSNTISSNIVAGVSVGALLRKNFTSVGSSTLRQISK